MLSADELRKLDYELFGDDDMLLEAEGKLFEKDIEVFKNKADLLMEERDDIYCERVFLHSDIRLSKERGDFEEFKDSYTERNAKLIDLEINLVSRELDFINEYDGLFSPDDKFMYGQNLGDYLYVYSKKEEPKYIGWLNDLLEMRLDCSEFRM